MKITKTELIQTIKEEFEDILESPEDPHDKLDRMLKDRGVESDKGPDETDEDYWKRREKKGMSDLFKSGIPQRAARNLPENKMKITKTKLMKIIQEELNSVLDERVETPEGDFLRSVGIRPEQAMGAELTDLPPEAMEELSQLMNQPKVQRIQDSDRRTIIMNSYIDWLKEKYGIQ
jgi:hypothetical protein